MYSFDTDRASERQRRFWNAVGSAWRADKEQIETWMLPLTRAINDRIGNYPGYALDLGCGARSMALPDSWRVFGVDPASEMLVPNKSVQGDPQRLPFQDAAFDAVVSRLAVMLDSNPLAALRETHRVMRISGTLTFAVWDTAEKNEWISSAEAALAEILGIRKPEASEPSAYRLSNPDEVSSLLSAAGFRRTSADSVLLPYFGQRTSEETFDFLLHFIGPIRTMFEKLSPEVRESGRAKVVAALADANRNGSAWVHHAIREPKSL
jgi:SAM-dependent methyltransferase